MRSLAALGQEAADGGILGGRFEQFDARAAQREHGGFHLFVLDRLFVRGGDAERCIESTRLGDAAHRDSDVIELGMFHQGLHAASSYGLRGSTSPAGWAGRDESFDLDDQFVYSFASGCHGTDNRRQPDLNSLPRPRRIVRSGRSICLLLRQWLPRYGQPAAARPQFLAAAAASRAPAWRDRKSTRLNS